MDREVLYVGGGFLLALVIGPALAFALLPVIKEPISIVLIGTFVSMAFYVGGCMLHRKHQIANSKTNR